MNEKHTLRRLTLETRGTVLPGSLGTQLAGLQNLESLQLSGVAADDFWREDDLRLPKLRRMLLPCLAMQDMQTAREALLSRAARLCPRLESLSLAGCRWVHLSLWPQSLPSLRVLCLDNTPVRRADLANLTGCCPALQDASFNACRRITGTDLRLLSGLPLERLAALGVHMTDADLAVHRSLASCEVGDLDQLPTRTACAWRECGLPCAPGARRLWLGRLAEPPPLRGARAWGRRCGPHLRELRLAAALFLDDALLACLGRHLKVLETLDVCGAERLTDDGLLRGVPPMVALRSLDLQACPQVTADGIRALGKRLRRAGVPQRIEKLRVRLFA
jgi:hypothetical protein